MKNKSSFSKKILVLGANGMLGYSIFKYFSLKSSYKTAGILRSKQFLKYFNKNEIDNLFFLKDIRNFKSLEKYLINFQPNYVINCIGIIKQSKKLDDPISIIEINSILPHRLAVICKKINSKLIHFSTDCVFNGKKGNYIESDKPNADDIYGKSKFLGELNYSNNLTIRTSIIGHELVNNLSLLNWFLSQNEKVEGYSKAVFSGLPAVYIAEILEKFILESSLSGLYHLSSEPIDKYTLLCMIAKTYNKKIEIINSNKLVIDRSLNSARIKKELDLIIPSWNDLIKKMYYEYLTIHI